jgi:hypothetical protein
MDILIDVTANDYHPEGDVMTVSLLAAPQAGSVVVHDDGSLTFSLPDPGSLSEITFTYQVTDSRGRTDTASVSIGGGVSSAPVAVNDHYSQVFGVVRELPVLDNDVGEDLSILSVSPPGVATILPGSQSLEYFSGNAGTNVFTYTVGNASGSDEGVVTVTVDGAPATISMGEVGEIANLTHQPQWVDLAHAYASPVVIVQPPTLHGADVSAVRILARGGAG